jgi:hypothetical protein
VRESQNFARKQLKRGASYVIICFYFFPTDIPGFKYSYRLEMAKVYNELEVDPLVNSSHPHDTMLGQLLLSEVYQIRKTKFENLITGLGNRSGN